MMNESSEIPKFSLVIEWDNVRLSEARRAKKMFEELQKQLLEVGKYASSLPEILVAYDRFAVDPHLIEQMTRDVFTSQDLLHELKIIASDGLGYYELKNFGAQHAHGDVIVFLDSDVIPEDGWLAALLNAFHDPAVHVVCGNTYIHLQGLYSKAFALFWFFPLREEGIGLRQTRYFFANNIAFRREVFDSNPYPRLPQYRGQCVALADQLAQRGIPVFLQREARVSHPPPNGLRHFVYRALVEGYDAVVINERNGKGNKSSFRNCYLRYRDSLGSSFTRIRYHYRDVGLGYAGVVGAAAIACCYYTLKLAGELITLRRPELARRYFAL